MDLLKHTKLQILFLLLCQVAHAAPASPSTTEYCGELRKITRLIDRCEHNRYLGELGLRCAVKLSSSSRVAAQALSEKLLTDASTQRGGLQSSAANLASADSVLAKLVASSEVAIEENLRLMLNLVHPDELYEADARVDPNAMLRQTPCFRDNKRKLLISLTEIEENRNGLIRAREALKSISGRTSSEIKAMLQAVLQPIQSQPGAGGSVAPAFRKKTHPAPASDITGTKPLEKK